MGGKEALPHTYPWTVALTGYPQLGNFFCGATIISSRFLITAAHCFYLKDDDWSFDKVRVKVGVHNLTDKNVLIFKPKSYKIYEGFTEENEIDAPLLDIALIELEEDLPVSSKIRPICLHSKYFNYYINDLKEKRHLNRAKRDIFGSVSNFFGDQYNKLFGGTVDTIDEPFEEKSKFNEQIELKPVPKFNEHASATQPTDKHKIILDHPDKNLIRQVVDTVGLYYLEIRNDPLKIFDPAKEFTKDKLTVAGWGSIDRYDLSKLPDVLMETDIRQKKPDICENAYGDDVFFRSKMICANDAGEF